VEFGGVSKFPKKHERVFLLHQGLVRALAWRLHRRTGRYVEIDDLIAYGQIGLLEAIRSFDEERGIKFSTYAWYRVRGAIFDGLMKMSWFNRIAFEQGEYEFEIKEKSSKPRKTPQSEKKESQDRSSVRRQQQPSLSGGFDGNVPGDLKGVDSAVVHRELLVFLRDLVSALPEKEAQLIKEKFFVGRTLTEAARRVGISVAWASRLHARTLADLRIVLEQSGFASGD
jgi:RNA polymerase sigma factor for flagellar operon FliA